MNASEVAGVVVTRGDVDLAPVLAGLAQLGETVVYDNSLEPVDLGVAGRYAAVARATREVVLVQDDDVALPEGTVTAFLAAYEPGVIVANMPQPFRARYSDSCLIGFGAIFDRDLPARVFASYHGHHHPDAELESFNRTCDVVFTTLTPRLLVDFPYEELPQTRAPNRMYRQPGHTTERVRMLNHCRKIRDSRGR